MKAPSPSIVSWLGLLVSLCAVVSAVTGVGASWGSVVRTVSVHERAIERNADAIGLLRAASAAAAEEARAAREAAEAARAAAQQAAVQAARTAGKVEALIQTLERRRP